jgi:hypothetical protein
MSRRQDDDSLDELVSDLSTTLTDLQDVLADEQGNRQQPRRRRRPPSPGRFLRFTEEYTIPTLISLLETNIRALELFQGLLGLINGRDNSQQSNTKPFGSDRRVQKTGRRTLGALDDALSDLQGALEGEPTDSEARSLLDDARSLRGEIDNRLSDAGARERTRSNRSDRSDRSDHSNQSNRSGHSNRSNRSADRDNNEAIRIDVMDEETNEDKTSETSDENQADDQVNVDDELETIKNELQDDDDTPENE